MHHSRLRVALATISVLALLPLAAAPAMAHDGAKTQHERIVAHWTKERIANAKPRDLVKTGGAPNAAPGPKGRPAPPPPSGGAVLGASWTAGGPILAKSGRVLFTMGGGDWICSGTSVSDGGRADYSMVLTAGHCAIDETNGQFKMVAHTLEGAAPLYAPGHHNHSNTSHCGHP